MQSLYSYILWEKMGLDPQDFPIHKKSLDEILEKFLVHLKSVGPEQYIKDVEHLSPFDKTEEDPDLYYDGRFHYTETSIHRDFIKEDPENPERVIVRTHFHDTSIDPMILSLMLKFIDPNTAQFFADIVKEYHKNKKEEDENN